MSVPMRSIPLPGWNGFSSSGQKGGASNGGSPAPGQSVTSPGGAFVWNDASLMLGPFDTGIHTRILKDGVIIALSLALLALGLVLMAKPDLSQVVSTAVKALPEVAA